MQGDQPAPPPGVHGKIGDFLSNPKRGDNEIVQSVHAILLAGCRIGVIGAAGGAPRANTRLKPSDPAKVPGSSLLATPAKARVGALGRKQRIVPAALDDAPIHEHENLVCGLNG